MKFKRFVPPFFIISVALFCFLVNYFVDKKMHNMPLNSEIQLIETDAKNIMYIKVVGHNDNIALGHEWPKFQQEAKVGDYVIKESRKDSLVLIKKGTRIKIICPMYSK